MKLLNRNNKCITLSTCESHFKELDDFPIAIIEELFLVYLKEEEIAKAIKYTDSQKLLNLISNLCDYGEVVAKSIPPMDAVKCTRKESVLVQNRILKKARRIQNTQLVGNRKPHKSKLINDVSEVFKLSDYPEKFVFSALLELTEEEQLDAFAFCHQDPSTFAFVDFICDNSHKITGTRIEEHHKNTTHERSINALNRLIFVSEHFMKNPEIIGGKGVERSNESVFLYHLERFFKANKQTIEKTSGIYPFDALATLLLPLGESNRDAFLDIFPKGDVKKIKVELSKLESRVFSDSKRALKGKTEQEVHEYANRVQEQISLDSFITLQNLSSVLDDKAETQEECLDVHSSTTAFFCSEAKSDTVELCEQVTPVISKDVFDKSQLEDVLMVRGITGDNGEELISQILEKGPSKTVLYAKESMLSEVDKLKCEFPNFSKVLDELYVCLKVSIMSETPIEFPVINLQGAPGVGKTEFIRTLCKRLELEFFDVSIASMTGKQDLVGGSSQFKHASIGEVAKALLVKGTSYQPCLLLDELCLAKTDGQYSLVPALLGLLDIEQKKSLKERYLDINLDCSGMLIFTTTNNFENLLPAIKSRLSNYDIAAPSPEDMAVICQNIYSRYLDEKKISRFFSPEIHLQVVDKLCNKTPREAKSAIISGLKKALAQSDLTAKNIKLLSHHLPSTYGSAQDKQPVGFIH